MTNLEQLKAKIVECVPEIKNILWQMLISGQDTMIIAIGTSPKPSITKNPKFMTSYILYFFNFKIYESISRKSKT